MNVLKMLVRRNRPGPQMPVYEYDTIGNEISVEGSVIQAAHTLDLAAQMAADAADSTAMLVVAEYWKNLADFIMALSEHKRKNELEDNKSDLPMGFQPSNITEKEDDVRSDDDGADEGSSADGVHPEYGQFRIFANRRGGRGLRAIH